MKLAPLLALALVACTYKLPVPRTGDHRGDEPEPVPFPPPPGRVEIVPPPADMKKPVWIDGEWLWAGRRWVWQDGRWQETPSEDSYFAPPATVRLSDGNLAHFKGTWKKGAPEQPK